MEFYRCSYPEATQLCTRAKELFSEAGDRHGEVRSLRDLGLIALREKDMERAKARITEAKRICEDVGYPLKKAGLGKYFDSKGRWVEPPSVTSLYPPTPVSPV